MYLTFKPNTTVSAKPNRLKFHFELLLNLFGCLSFLKIVPGSVTNHKVYKKDGIVIEWSAPTKPNGILKYYLIEWTIGNQTQSQQITYESDIVKNIFSVNVFE